MSAHEVLAELDALIAAAAPEDLPTVLGRLVELEERARLRLRSAPVPVASGDGAAPAPERLLTPEEAIDVLGGNVSRKWVLRHTRGLRFRRDLSRKVVRFEEAGLRRWAAARRA